MNSLLKKINSYYTNKIDLYGPTPKGVDWKNQKSQTLRFDHLLYLINENSGSILDFGCGYGAFYEYLKHKGSQHKYTGYDIVRDSIEIAKKKYSKVFWTSDFELLKPHDFVVASGVFNTKMNVSNSMWCQHVKKTILKIGSLAKKGFAINFLTTYSDASKKRSDLYYASPEFFFRYCIKKFGHRVAILHDSELYDFTIVVRK